MSELIRFGISLPKNLSKDFDKYIKDLDYNNRSEAIRDLIRNELIKKEWEEKESDIAGAIIFIYDHHVRELQNKITSIQHDFYSIIISTQHIHLDHNNCLEIVAIKGNSKKVKKLYNMIRSTKDIKHATLSMSSTGKNIY